MNLQNTTWTVNAATNCGLQQYDTLTFGAEGSGIIVFRNGNTLPPWGKVEKYVNTGAEVTYGGMLHEIVLKGSLLVCEPQSLSNSSPNPLVNLWSSSGIKKDGAKLLPWLVSIAVGIAAGTIVGSRLGVPLDAALAVAGITALGMAAGYKFLNVINPAGDPGGSWTAQGITPPSGTGFGPDPVVA